MCESRTASSPRRSRPFARHTSSRSRHHERAPVRPRTVVDDCGLVLGELVANAIKADADTIDVSVQLHHGRIEPAVTDDAQAGRSFIDPTWLRPADERCRSSPPWPPAGASPSTRIDAPSSGAHESCNPTCDHRHAVPVPVTCTGVSAAARPAPAPRRLLRNRPLAASCSSTSPHSGGRLRGRDAVHRRRRRAPTQARMSDGSQ